MGVAICGRGIGGLSCAWRLAKSGRHDVVVVEGPERYGNAAGGAFGAQRFPLGDEILHASRGRVPGRTLHVRQLRQRRHDHAIHRAERETLLDVGDGEDR